MIPGGSHALRCARLCVFLAGCYCGGAALAQTHVEDTDSDTTWWAFGICMTAGAIGFGTGAKIRLTRDIVNAS